MCRSLARSSKQEAAAPTPPGYVVGSSEGGLSHEVGHVRSAIEYRNALATNVVIEGATCGTEPHDRRAGGCGDGRAGRCERRRCSCGLRVAVGSGVLVGAGMGVGTAVGVLVGTRVGVGAAVGVSVGIAVGMGVPVGVLVGTVVGVGIAAGTVGVGVGVGVPVCVAVFVGVGARASIVAWTLARMLACIVAWASGVGVGVSVGIAEAMAACTVASMSGVGSAGGDWTQAVALPVETAKAPPIARSSIVSRAVLLNQPEPDPEEVRGKGRLGPEGALAEPSPGRGKVRGLRLAGSGGACGEPLLGPEDICGGLLVDSGGVWGESLLEPGVARVGRPVGPDGTLDDFFPRMDESRRPALLFFFLSLPQSPDLEERVPPPWHLTQVQAAG